MQRLQCVGFAADAVCIYLAQTARLGVFAAGQRLRADLLTVFVAVVVLVAAIST